MEQAIHKITTQPSLEASDFAKASTDTSAGRPLIQAGDIFRHYKGNLYKIICVSCHSEDLTWYVVYETLYDNNVSKIWHRPLDMFLGSLEVDGKRVQRFEKVT